LESLVIKSCYSINLYFYPHRPFSPVSIFDDITKNEHPPPLVAGARRDVNGLFQSRTTMALEILFEK